VWWYIPVIPALGKLRRRIVSSRPAWAICQYTVTKKEINKIK
jgi:hypothetical protein